jgi:hypothetical protein
MIKSRRMRWTEYVARMRETRNAYRILVGKPKEKTLLGIPRRRWMDNIKIDLKEIIARISKLYELLYDSVQ